MAKSQRKQKKPVEKPAQLFQPKDFLDLIAPAAVKFNTDSYVLGGLYRCVLALRGYPAATEELALLSHICNRAGVTLHLYARQVTAAEEDAIYHKAVNKNRLDRSNQDNLKRSVTGVSYLLISHDLDLLRHASSRIGIMYRGKLLEQGETEAVLNAPTHPYTRELIENFSYMRD